MFFSGWFFGFIVFITDSFDWLLEMGIIDHNGNPNEYIGFFLILLDVILIYFMYVGIKTKIKEWKS